jgi:hypothetical protein
VCAVTDNEPTMNAAADLLPFDWHGCVDHLIELTTGIAFDGQGVKDMMTKIRSLVGQFNSSNINCEKLDKAQHLLNPNGNAVGVIQDVATRWWSTYNMLHRLLRLRQALQILDVKKDIKHYPTNEEWDLVEIVCLVQGPFMLLQ